MSPMCRNPITCMTSDTVLCTCSKSWALWIEVTLLGTSNTMNKEHVLINNECQNASKGLTI